jgi:methyl acetate hydrolase
MAETVRPTTSIDAVLQDAVERAVVPGVVAMAAGDDGVIYEGAAGVRSVDADDPIAPDTMMRIASMTKMVTTVAGLQLVDRSEIELDAPVDTYRPEFADLPVLEGFDGDTPRLRPPRTRATVRQLMTHTAGLAYWIWNADIERYSRSPARRTSCPGRSTRSRRRSCSTPARASSTASTSTGSAWSSRR